MRLWFHTADSKITGGHVLRRMRDHFRHQFVGYLALFVALGGTTYAAATIGANDIKRDAVRTRHIKNGEVTNADLGANSVGSGKVLRDTLTGADIKESSLGVVPFAASVGGVRESTINVTQPIHTAPVVVFDRNGLRITMNCGIQGIAEPRAALSTLGSHMVATVARSGADTVMFSGFDYTNPDASSEAVRLGSHTWGDSQGVVSVWTGTRLTTLDFTVPNGAGPGCELYGHVRVSSL